MSRWPLHDTTSDLFSIYSRANVGEIFPDPITPLNASAGFQAYLELGWRDAFVNCGVWNHDLYDLDEGQVDHIVLPAFGSYLYINMSLMRLFGVRVPGFTVEAVDLQYFGEMPGIPPYEDERRDFDENAEFEQKAGAWLVEQVLGATDLAAHDADRELVRSIRDQRPDLTALSDEELVARVTGFGDELRRIFANHIEASLKCGVGLGGVAQVAEAIGRPELGLDLVQGLGDVDSTAPSIAMWALSRKAIQGPVATLFDQGVEGLFDRLRASDDESVTDFVTDFEAFLDDWGFRGAGEWEIRADTWGTRPDLALAQIDRLRLVDASENPELKHTRRAADREEAAATIREALEGDEEALGQFEAALHAAALWMRGRERQRTTGAMMMHELRLTALEWGRRLVERGELDDAKQVFMLFADEIDDFRTSPAEWAAALREREATYRELMQYQPPFVTRGQPVEYTEWARRDAVRSDVAAAGTTLRGVPGCSGTAKGTARVLHSANDPSALNAGEILVAPITDPSWTPLFMSAAAVVVDVGAPFSHAAIVSRELGIPCVVSAASATQQIPDGATIEVDGTSGTVTILEH